MKKNENVILSNDIEIINGIEVDWSKYKGKDNNKTRKGYIGLCELLHKNGHTLESNYINAKIKVNINFNCRHKPHSIRPDAYKTGNGCSECKKEKLREKNRVKLIEMSIKPNKKKSKKAELELYDLAEERGHKILGDYINAKTSILIDFNCGHKPHSIRPNNYKNGQSCPICKASKGEMEVARALKDMNIDYEEQYKFEDCRCVNPLPFDFYISEFNLCIEYDGHHHYKATPYLKKEYNEYQKAKAKKIAEERVKEVQRRDKIKTEYCKENGINLIRIPYWEFDNIEKIIKKELSKYTQVVD